jgi:hypothetical protein
MLQIAHLANGLFAEAHQSVCHGTLPRLISVSLDDDGGALFL